MWPGGDSGSIAATTIPVFYARAMDNKRRHCGASMLCSSGGGVGSGVCLAQCNTTFYCAGVALSATYTPEPLTHTHSTSYRPPSVNLVQSSYLPAHLKVC